MKTIIYYLTEPYEDRDNWGPGPWQDEPDKKQWLDKETGLPCLIVRNRLGALCGYVGVSKGHPCFGKESGDKEVMELEAHGGITFANKCSDYEHGVCHKVEPGEDDDVWWLGFDCGHLFDLTPALMSRYRKLGLPTPPPTYTEQMIYRDFPYVEEQVTGLAAQLKAMEPSEEPLELSTVPYGYTFRE